MSSRDRSDATLAAEAARRRRELRAEEARHRETRDVLDHANQMLLGLWLRDFLTDPTDFDTWIGRAAVTDRSGRIDWSRARLLIDELLDAKPHLAAPTAAALPRPGARGLHWLTN